MPDRPSSLARKPGFRRGTVYLLVLVTTLSAGAIGLAGLAMREAVAEQTSLLADLGQSRASARSAVEMAINMLEADPESAYQDRGSGSWLTGIELGSSKAAADVRFESEDGTILDSAKNELAELFTIAGNDKVYASVFGRAMTGDTRVRLFAKTVIEQKSVSGTDHKLRFPIDEGAGVTLALESDSRHFGYYTSTQSASATVGPFGDPSAALRDGTQFITIPHHNHLRWKTGTISLWSRIPAGTGRRALLCLDDNSDDTTGGTLRIWFMDGAMFATTEYDERSATIGAKFAYEPTEWVHTAVSFGNDGLSLYVNGAIIAMNKSWTDGLDEPGNAGSQALLLGTELSGGGVANPLLGALADLRVYHKQLSPDEIRNIARSGEPEGHSYTVRFEPQSWAWITD